MDSLRGYAPLTHTRGRGPHGRIFNWNWATVEKAERQGTTPLEWRDEVTFQGMESKDLRTPLVVLYVAEAFGRHGGVQVGQLNKRRGFVIFAGPVVRLIQE